MRKSALAAALLCAGIGTAMAQTGSTGSSTSGGTTATSPSTGGTAGAKGSMGSSEKGSLDRSDRKFIEDAAVSGMAEVELGKLAQQKATDPQVKQFGEHMVQDHSKANDQLKQTASAKGVQIPTSLDKKHQGEMDKLQKLSGADFDRQYMQRMVSEHKKDVSEFEKAAKSAKDSEVKSFASQTLPTLQDHLKMAQSTHDSVKNNKGDKSGAMGSGTSGHQGSTSGSGTTAKGTSTGQK